MPDPIDIPGIDAIAKLLGDAVKSGNKEMLNEFAVGIRQGILEEGRKLIKEAGLPDEDDDYDWDEMEESVAAGAQRGVEAGEKAAEAKRMRVIADTVTRALGKQRVERFEFDKTRGMAAVESLSKQIAIPSGAGEKLPAEFQKAMGVRAYKQYVEKAKLAVEKLVASGEDMTELMDDEEALGKIRLKILHDTISQHRIKSLSDKKIVLMEEALLIETAKELQIKKRRNIIANKYDEVASTMAAKIGGIPVVGEGLSRGFEKIASDPKVKEAVVSRISKLTQAIAPSGSKMSNFFVGPPGGGGPGIGGVVGKGLAIGGAIALFAILAKILQRLVKLVGLEIQLNSEIVKATGLTRRLATTMEPAVKSAADMAMSAGLFAGETEDAQKAAMAAASALISEFGSLSEVSTETIQFTTLLAERLGVGAEGAARIVGAWNKQLGISGKHMLTFSGALKAGAEKYGLSFAQLMEDSAQSAGTLALYVGRSENRLAAAVVNARRLGTTLESQRQTAEQFESFEDAISNAFTVQFLTGEKMNAQQLYAQANYGNALDIQTKMVSAFERARREQHLGVIQQKNLAQAMGMTVEQINSIIARREEERKVVGELAELDKRFGTNLSDRKNKDLEYNKRALRELQALRPGEQIDAGAVTARAAEVKRAEALAKSDVYNIMSALGIADITSSTDKLLAKAVSTLDRILKAIAGPIASAVVAIAEWLMTSSLFGETDPTKMSEDQLRIYMNKQGMGTYDEMGRFQLGKFTMGPTEQGGRGAALSQAKKYGMVSQEDINRNVSKISMGQANPFRGGGATPSSATQASRPIPVHGYKMNGEAANDMSKFSQSAQSAQGENIVVNVNVEMDGDKVSKKVVQNISRQSKDKSN